MMSLRRAYAQMRRHWSLAAALSLACATLWVSLAVSVRTAAEFPRVSPSHLAHLLSDFSNHPRLYPNLGSWTIEKESSNYTSWRYSVVYSCGVRCSGRADVTSHDEHAGAGVPQHGSARSHRVLVAHRSCSRLPLLLWPTFCTEWETETVVSQAGNGAFMSETAWAYCGVLRVLTGGCVAELRAARTDHLHRLRALVHLQYQ